MVQIRKAALADVSRLAEILVFNNRLLYFPIFRSEAYSFGELQVVPVAQGYRDDPERLGETWVYDADGIVKGLIQLHGEEVRKLYVEPSFQGQGIGAALLDFAVTQHGAAALWVLEKNTRALAFYARHGFSPTGEWAFEPDTPERLLLLRRRRNALDVSGKSHKCALP